MPTYDIHRLAPFLKDLKRFPKRKLALSVGDSWFQYPLRKYLDLQRRAATAFNRELLMVDDSYPGRDADEVPGISRRWTELAATLQSDFDRPLDLILVSLGGNDIIGKDFARHLKPAGEVDEGNFRAELPDVVRRHVRLVELQHSFDKIRHAYRQVIALRDSHAPNATLLTHTYADVIPSPTPYRFLFIQSGPWMWEPMRAVGLVDAGEQRILTRWLLESFAAVLKTLQENTPGMQVLDSRLELVEKRFWDNEIHPTGAGFKHLFDAYWKPAIAGALLM